MNDIRNLNPRELWNYFYEITSIPHPSGKEKAIVQYVKEVAGKNNIEALTDRAGNLILRKAATPGMESRAGIILQSHLDMVPQKNNDTLHDFEKDPIETWIDGDWVKARGTTLGADNGIGVAATLAVMTSPGIKHGPLEALMTIEEETGMTGARDLEPGLLKGDIMINTDSEDEGELYVGCAGGIDVTASMNYSEVAVPSGMVTYKIDIKGLKGGHSGMDIALGRANANKLLFRFLMHAESDYGIRLVSASVGDLRNAIPREGHAVVTVPSDKAEAFEPFVREYEEMYRAEFSDTEPDLQFTTTESPAAETVLESSDQYKIIRALFVTPNGVLRMSTAMDNLVETSNNLAIVKIAGGEFLSLSLTRSSVDSAKEATAWKIAAAYQLIGAEVKLDGDYPGWKPNMESAIFHSMRKVYKDIYGVVPETRGIHAGLECGIIGSVYPGLDMISFGPTIRYPHSPDEKVNIPSVEKFYNFMVATLEAAPEKSDL